MSTGLCLSLKSTWPTTVLERSAAPGRAPIKDTKTVLMAFPEHRLPTLFQHADTVVQCRVEGSRLLELAE